MCISLLVQLSKFDCTPFSLILCARAFIQKFFVIFHATIFHYFLLVGFSAFVNLYVSPFMFVIFMIIILFFYFEPFYVCHHFTKIKLDVMIIERRFEKWMQHLLHRYITSNQVKLPRIIETVSACRRKMIEMKNANQKCESRSL